MLFFLLNNFVWNSSLVITHFNKYKNIYIFLILLLLIIFNNKVVNIDIYYLCTLINNNNTTKI